MKVVAKMPSIRARPIGRAKEVRLGDAASESLRRGLRRVADAVAVTFGPGGRAVLLEREGGAPNVSRDGYTVANTISLPDRMEDIGARIMREASKATAEKSGDGSTTATVLARALVDEGARLMAAGASGMLLRRGIEAAATHVGRQLGLRAEPADDERTLTAIATTAVGVADGGRLVGEMVRELGGDGQIRVQTGPVPGLQGRYVRGMQMDRGWASPRFVTDPQQKTAALDAPLILLTGDRIQDPRLMAALLGRIATVQPNRPVVIVALEFSQAALELLTVNVHKGALQALAMAAPGIGQSRFEILQDLAACTGATVLPGLGLALGQTPAFLEGALGSAGRIVAWRTAALIADGAGEAAAVAARAEVIQRQVEASPPGFERRIARERLARLAGRVGVIEVGAATEAERLDLVRRLTGAVEATKWCLRDGAVPGGGSTLAWIADEIDPAGWPENERQGVLAMKRALTAPLCQISTNAGYDGDLVLETMMSKDRGMGFDAGAGRYGDLREAGVVDSVEVLRTAVRHAATVAGTMLSTGAAVHYSATAQWPRDSEDAPPIG